MLTLYQMSFTYRESAVKIRMRMTELRSALHTATPEEARRIRRRMAELRPMLWEMVQLAELTEHYYDKEYYRHEAYRV